MSQETQERSCFKISLDLNQHFEIGGFQPKGLARTKKAYKNGAYGAWSIIFMNVQFISSYVNILKYKSSYFNIWTVHNCSSMNESQCEIIPEDRKEIRFYCAIRGRISLLLKMYCWHSYTIIAPSFTPSSSRLIEQNTDQKILKSIALRRRSINNRSCR